MRKWKWFEYVPSGTKIRFVDSAAYDWLKTQKVDPSDIFTIISCKNVPWSLEECDVKAEDSKGNVIKFTNGSVISVSAEILE